MCMFGEKRLSLIEQVKIYFVATLWCSCSRRCRYGCYAVIRGRKENRPSQQIVQSAAVVANEDDYHERVDWKSVIFYPFFRMPGRFIQLFFFGYRDYLFTDGIDGVEERQQPWRRVDGIPGHERKEKDVDARQVEQDEWAEKLEKIFYCFRWVAISWKKCCFLKNILYIYGARICIR